MDRASVHEVTLRVDVNVTFEEYSGDFMVTALGRHWVAFNLKDDFSRMKDMREMTDRPVPDQEVHLDSQDIPIVVVCRIECWFKVGVQKLKMVFGAGLLYYLYLGVLNCFTFCYG